MKAAETTLLGLLQGSKVFLIPNFQCRYAWRKQQWEELWDDLIREYSADHDPYSSGARWPLSGKRCLAPRARQVLGAP